MINFKTAAIDVATGGMATGLNLLNNTGTGFLTNAMESARSVVGTSGPEYPAPTGNGSRMAAIQPNRSATPTRKMMQWFVPECGIIEMYINPQNVTYQDKKHITEQRTKGGYVLQYWGEELGTIAINGTTGSSGVEGINVLYDIYRSEQVSFDPFALAIQANESDYAFNASDADILSIGSITGGNTVSDLLTNSLETGNANVSRPRPTLASLAFTVELYWDGWTFRGYFTDFRLDEKADRVGLFDYSMNFKYTQRRGLRVNFQPWHRSPTNGPSDNSAPEEGGVPFSYNSVSQQYFNSAIDSLDVPNADKNTIGLGSIF